ncbi:MAG: 16S rRNA (cytosine(1402)-N(4))-methyltransferase RsmH [Verrucomicrobia bacterium]|nr:16S rRNA (cytosine(1402)-N(4))-methyltransferase RsmH [Verrucomicrobiota bacterium]
MDDPVQQPFQRRKRYQGKPPKRFEEKYKELDPDLDPETIAKVITSGKTPAGQHRPILVAEILECLGPECGQRGVDVTFGYGGHSEALLEKLHPAGQLLALDVDTQQLPKTEARLRRLGYGEDALIVRRCNFAGTAGILQKLGWTDGVDFLLADLGLSSMQIDNPERGFSYKHDGPLDMRMNPERGAPARDWLARCSTEKLATALTQGSDDPHAHTLAESIVAAQAAQPIETTRQLRDTINAALPERTSEDDRKATAARVFQAIRIAVNEEFTALDIFLQKLPHCLRPGGKVAILSFHSGEDRRVKHHLREGFRSGIYSAISQEIIRPSPKEIGENSRAASAKMRWAIRAVSG